jgi:hypothetical protein
MATSQTSVVSRIEESGGGRKWKLVDWFSDEELSALAVHRNPGAAALPGR